MTQQTTFTQLCPICGRRVQVRVMYLGRAVVCQHCRGNFVAADPHSQRLAAIDEADSPLMRRVDPLLSVERRAHPR